MDNSRATYGEGAWDMVIREYSRSMVACKRWPVIIIMCVAGKRWIGIRDRLPRVGEIRDREGTRLDEVGEKTRDRTS